MSPSASAHSEPRSPGASTCSTHPSVICSSAWRCSRVDGPWKRPRPCAVRIWTHCNRWSSAAWCGGNPTARASTMLETIREFARERFEARPDAEALRRLHAEHFVSDADQADAVLVGGPTQHDRIASLDAELDNHRAALRWALDGADPELGLRLVARLGPVWWLRRPLSEARRWLGEALDAAPPAPTHTRALALNWAGFLAGEQGDDGRGAP